MSENSNGVRETSPACEEKSTLTPITVGHIGLQAAGR